MKTKKIKFVGFWEGFDPENNYIYKALKANYDVQIVDDPDYIICSMFGQPYTYCKYPQVRIMYSGENYIPDFNLIDYAVCQYPINFQDRCYYMPECVDIFGHCQGLEIKDREYTREWLKQKEHFANFIASHESEYGIRGEFFKKLNEYKRVESPGTYLSNCPGVTVNFMNSSKIEFQRKCKFTLCFESTSHNGFTTEKITDAFYADTIPVYYGNPEISKIFNTKAFINCMDYPNFDAVIDEIIRLDNDDDAYLKIMHQPILVQEQFATKKIDGLELFLKNIFDQPLDSVYRRSRVYSPKRHEDFLKKIITEHDHDVFRIYQYDQGKSIKIELDREYLRYLPNRIAINLFGREKYEHLKKLLK